MNFNWDRTNHQSSQRSFTHVSLLSCVIFPDLRIQKEEAEALFMYQMSVTTAKFTSCVIINTALRKGQEVSEAGEQTTKIVLAGTASGRFQLSAPQRGADTPATAHRTRLREQVGTLVQIMTFGEDCVLLERQSGNWTIILSLILTTCVRWNVSSVPFLGLSLLTCQIRKLDKTILRFPSRFEVIFCNALHSPGVSLSLTQNLLSTNTVHLD